MNDIAELLRGYLRFVKVAGDGNISGPCPFHKDGMEKRPSFYMSTTKGVFFCHACGARGTLAQFLKSMGASRDQVDAAMEGIVFESRDKIERRRRERTLARLSEAVLGIFDYCPTDLVKAGFSQKLMKELEIGFDKHHCRITFPLRDKHGSLVAVIGRTVVEGAYPRYKCYSGEDFLPFVKGDAELEAFYHSYEINHRAFLWNAHRVYAGMVFKKVDQIVVVEGYKACMWMIQNGWPNTVAIQGSQSTHDQEELLAYAGVPIYLLLDNNFAGRMGVLKTGGRLVDRWGQRVRVCEYPLDRDEDAQPDNLDMEALHGVFDAATDFRKWRVQWKTILESSPSLSAPRSTFSSSNNNENDREAGSRSATSTGSAHRRT